MRARAAVFVVAVLGILAPATAAKADADSTINDVVTALQASPVDVVQGSPNTSATLVNQLNSGDHIAIVMLPADRVADITDPQSFVARLDDATGHQYIIGLTIGDKAQVASSTLLPSGQASDLMDRAHNVSVDPTETMVSFIQNVHRYEAQHPIPVTAMPVSSGSGVNGTAYVVVGLVAFVGVAAIGSMLVRRKRKSRPIAHPQPDVRFRPTTPTAIATVLRSILAHGRLIEDADLRASITQLVRDVDRDFEVSNIDNAGADMFGNKLKDINDVLEGYVEVQNQPREYGSAVPELLRQGKAAVESFGRVVLEDIQSTNQAKLIPYNVNTELLQQKRQIH
ncbi:MAG: hypothetical protein JWN38_814 [Candidatus Saccharibacteria bacterium]|nr:hypothetical protein [Candidatus Saccharibacteria bacterium]